VFIYISNCLLRLAHWAWQAVALPVALAALLNKAKTPYDVVMITRGCLLTQFIIE
jgi:hypothetical protein